jgi:cytochrome c556
LTNINSAAAFVVTMKFNPYQEDAMSSKAKSATVSSAARTRAAKPPGRRERGAATAPEVWEQTAQAPDERDDEIDCQRIVQRDGSRSLPLYYDDYN